MGKIIPFIIVFILAAAPVTECGAEVIGGAPIVGKPTAANEPDISLAYLQQARAFRDQGRFELSRQSYAMALSTCKNTANLEIIRRELAGVELLIRTMR